MCFLFVHVNSLAHNCIAQVELGCENEAGCLPKAALQIWKSS